MRTATLNAEAHEARIKSMRHGSADIASTAEIEQALAALRGPAIGCIIKSREDEEMPIRVRLCQPCSAIRRLRSPF